eukprot:1762145-Lingulodinium_polyedra.AAC.1
MAGTWRYVEVCYYQFRAARAVSAFLRAAGGLQEAVAGRHAGGPPVIAPGPGVGAGAGSGPSHGLELGGC